MDTCFIDRPDNADGWLARCGAAVPADDPDAETRRHLAALESLREAGTAIAESMRNRVVSAAAENKTDEKAAKAFCDVARTVEQVILLHQEVAGAWRKRRGEALQKRKQQARRIVTQAIEQAGMSRGEGDAADPASPVSGSSDLRTVHPVGRVRAVPRIRLDALFRDLDDDVFDGLSMAEIVDRACKLFGVTPDPTLVWPDWSELRGETPPADPAAAFPDLTSERPSGAESPPNRRRPRVPARFSGGIALGLDGPDIRPPPDRNARDPKGRDRDTRDRRGRGPPA